MAATVKKQIWLLSSDDGIAPTEEIGLITSTQGILIPGSLMYQSTSGTWTKADTSDGTGDTIHGVFAGTVNKSTTWPLTAELAANTEILIKRITTRQLFAVYCETGGADTTVAQTNVGNDYGLTIATGSGKVGYVTMALDNAHSTVTVVDIMSNRDTKATTSDSPGVAVVRFRAANIDATKA